MKNLIVFPYHNSQEISKYLQMGTIWKNITKTKFEYKFILASRFDIKPSRQLLESFSNIAPTRILQCHRRGKGIVRPQNRHIWEGPSAMFWDVMEDVSVHEPKDGGFVLWFEADMIPLTTDWLDKLSADWASGHYLMMGKYLDRSWLIQHIMPAGHTITPHINGGACYSKELYRYLPCHEFNPRKSWDIEISPYIQRNYPEQFKKTDLIDFWYKASTLIGKPLPGSVLLHGIKDESAFQMVCAGIKKSIQNHPDWWVEGVLTQSNDPQLPEPEKSINDWPWKGDFKNFYDPNTNWPKITVITPNFNYGDYLEQCIRSVLLQGYPNLEYIVLDDGSTDNSVEIIKKYERYLSHWQTGPNQGQTKILNQGFALATGEIVNWLCSDDYLLPQALFNVASAFLVDRQADVIIGRCFRDHLIRPDKSWLDYVRVEDLKRIPANHAFSQSACFFKRVLLAQRRETLSEKYDYAMDLELWAYFKSINVRWKIIDAALSVYQIHQNNKTSTGKDKITREFEDIYKTYVKERIPLTFWHRTLRYPLERFLARHQERAWYYLIAPIWVLLTLLLSLFYPFDRLWYMRWKRWAE